MSIDNIPMKFTPPAELLLDIFQCHQGSKRLDISLICKSWRTIVANNYSILPLNTLKCLVILGRISIQPKEGEKNRRFRFEDMKDDQELLHIMRTTVFEECHLLNDQILTVLEDLFQTGVRIHTKSLRIPISTNIYKPILENYVDLSGEIQVNTYGPYVSRFTEDLQICTKRVPNMKIRSNSRTVDEDFVRLIQNLVHYEAEYIEVRNILVAPFLYDEETYPSVIEKLIKTFESKSTHSFLEIEFVFAYGGAVNLYNSFVDAVNNRSNFLRISQHDDFRSFELKCRPRQNPDQVYRITMLAMPHSTSKLSIKLYYCQ